MSKLLLPTACTGKLLLNEPLAEYVSWRTGGPAEYLYIPTDLADLQKFIRAIPEAMPVTWLGLGSNVLVRDGGVKGVVIITQGALQKLDFIDSNQIRAEAGVASAQLARFAARHGNEALAFLAGIPGTVGGALAMNAGCYGGETWQYVTAVETIDRFGNLHQRSIKEFAVSYRNVQAQHASEWFVAGHFAHVTADKQQALQTIRQLLDKRNAAQPMGTANCGSVFRNPQGDYAARLIEQCGLKGVTIGAATVSNKHANFVINQGQAFARDIEQLIALVCSTVEEKTGVRLKPEVCIIGTD